MIVSVIIARKVLEFYDDSIIEIFHFIFVLFFLEATFKSRNKQFNSQEEQ